MAKDFAVQSYKKENKVWLWLLYSAIAVGVLGGVGWYVQQRSREVINPAIIATDNISELIEEKITEPEFYFYDVLQHEHEVADSDQVFGKFVLYLGHFTYHAEAVKLQKKLAKINYPANIKQNQEEQYVVLLGPYSSLGEAKEIGKLLFSKYRYHSEIKDLV